MITAYQRSLVAIFEKAGSDWPLTVADIRGRMVELGWQDAALSDERIRLEMAFLSAKGVVEPEIEK